MATDIPKNFESISLIHGIVHFSNSGFLQLYVGSLEQDSNTSISIINTAKKGETKSVLHDLCGHFKQGIQSTWSKLPSEEVTKKYHL